MLRKSLIKNEVSHLHCTERTGILLIAAAELVLLVPQASSEGSKRVSANLPLSFQDALEIIHDTIGCSSVSRKPALSYKLSTATQKAKPVDLCSDVDWQGCLEDVIAAENKKKGQTVPIVIIVPDQVSSIMICS